MGKARTFKPFILIMLILALSAGIVHSQNADHHRLADPDGQFIVVDGVELYLIAQGEPNNPAVILIHGFGGSTFTWRDVLPALVDAELYAIAVDLPPFGLSAKQDSLPYTQSWMADMVARLMDTIGVDKATVVGHSMGGGVAAQFAVRHPEKLEGLVFVSGGVWSSDTSSKGEGQQDESPLGGLAAFVESLDPTSPFARIALTTFLTADRFNETLLSAYYKKDVVTMEVQQGYQRPLSIDDWPVGFLSYIQAKETDPITLEVLAAATDVPVLILWGEQDSWVPIALGEEMHRYLAASEFIRYADSGHLPMEEVNDEFNKDLIAFLTSHR